MQPELKRVGQSGQISIGRQLAGKLLRLEQPPQRVRLDLNSPAFLEVFLRLDSTELAQVASSVGLLEIGACKCRRRRVCVRITRHHVSSSSSTFGSWTICLHRFNTSFDAPTASNR
jgi:hypothetical protein